MWIIILINAYSEIHRHAGKVCGVRWHIMSDVCSIEKGEAAIGDFQWMKVACVRLCLHIQCRLCLAVVSERHPTIYLSILMTILSISMKTSALLACPRLNSQGGWILVKERHRFFGDALGSQMRADNLNNESLVSCQKVWSSHHARAPRLLIVERAKDGRLSTEIFQLPVVRLERTKAQSWPSFVQQQRSFGSEVINAGIETHDIFCTHVGRQFSNYMWLCRHAKHPLTLRFRKIRHLQGC